MSDTKANLISYLKENGLNVVDSLVGCGTRIGARILSYPSAIDNADVLSNLKQYDKVVIQEVKEDTTSSIVLYLYPATPTNGLYHEISDEDKATFARHKQEIEDAYKTMGLK